MLGKLAPVLALLSRRSDLVMTILVVVAVIMMIIPLPTWLVDVLIATNIAASLLVLLVAFYIARPVEFSSLPSVILLATLFRLAITITTSRLILLQADAGQIISAFGDFVVGGNIAVGLVIFLIITIAQFVVITKGGERVAEVAARFSLDAMPGKQMSIDSELRSGDIDQAEARRQRRLLERESHLYGAMDGAMKFVKGDAMASIIVILVNLIGGLIVGTTQRGLDLGSAAATYSLLTVGDGLVAQISSLLVSVAAGTAVTRVASEWERDLSTEVTAQIFGEPRAMLLGAVILSALAFVPGFPAPAFLVLAALLAGGGFWSQRQAAMREAVATEREDGLSALPRSTSPAITAAAGPERLALPPVPSDAAIVVLLSETLVEAIGAANFEALTTQARAELRNDLGIECPPIGLAVDDGAALDRFRIDLDGVPVAEGAIPPSGLLVEDEPVHLDLLNVPYHQDAPIIDRRPALWVERTHEATLVQAGIAFSSPAQTLSRCLLRTLYRRAGHFVGVQETRRLVGRIQENYAELVKETEKVAPLPKLAEILRRLVDENVPVRSLRSIFEAVVEWGQREQNVVLLVEYVRMAIGRQVCFRYADGNRVIAAYMLDRAVEELLRSSARQTAVGTFLSLADDATRPLIDNLRRLLAATAPEEHPVLLAAMDVRRLARTLLTRNDIEIAVLSYQELAPEFHVQPLGTLSNGDTAVKEIADAIDRPENAIASENRGAASSALTAMDAK
jgi:type III secretion protein V